MPPSDLRCCRSPAAAACLPAAVYVLDELVQALAAGDTRAGVDAVSARLAHRSPVVKQKVGCVLAVFGACARCHRCRLPVPESSNTLLTCSQALKLVTHIGRKGSPDLRRLMARHSAAVRELLTFRCEPGHFRWLGLQVSARSLVSRSV